MTVHKRAKLLVFILVLAGVWLGGVVVYMRFDATAAPSAPLALHCRGASPMKGWCGCTWGEVLFQGRPVPGAAVTLTFESDSVTDTTGLDETESMPYFALTGQDLGARQGDVVTLSARFAGQTVERAIRAWPEDDGEQHIVLATLDRGVWSPLVTGGYTRTLALAGDTVWAGGPAGVISVRLSTGISTVHTLPWSNQSVRALAVGTNGHIWAAGTGGVAEFDGSAWNAHIVPFSHPLQALAVNTTTGAVWVGGGDYWAQVGRIAVYNGTWQSVRSFGAPVTALAVDAAGEVWVGIQEDGVYRRDGSGDWIHYEVGDGLASDKVLAIAAGAGAVWFGTEPYQSNKELHGGIARYDLGTGIWQVYTTTHGLPADEMFLDVPGCVYALALEPDGTVWAGTEQGVSFLAVTAWWGSYTTTHGLRPGPVMAVAAGNEAVVAAPSAGLDVLDRGTLLGNPPYVLTMTVDPPTLIPEMNLTLSGEGEDGDEGGKRIVAWDWSSDRQGPVCTTATCALPYSPFSPGSHTILLRVQDDEGVWSSPATKMIVVGRQVFLPLALRRSQSR